VLLVGLGFSLATAMAMASGVAAQTDGCCQYSVRTGNQNQRRCADLSQEACVALKPGGTFLRGLQCDGLLQRCLHSVAPPTVPPTLTRTTTPTRTPTPPPQSLVHGCCQINDRHRLGQSTCGNDIVEASCIEDFGVAAEFCENCSCSSHTDPGFSRDPGQCVAWTPGPTRTPTATPVRAPIGCCQLDNLRRVGHAVCGNTIAQLSCLGDYAGVPSFCLDCACSSHSAAGFSLDPGACVTRTPTPVPTRTPTPQLGCCELANFRGGHDSICGAVTEAACEADTRGQPTFCTNCVCSSHSGPGFVVSRGSCVGNRRPKRLSRPHVPHPPHAPH
jgi:hypothetical protein